MGILQHSDPVVHVTVIEKGQQYISDVTKYISDITTGSIAHAEKCRI